MNNLGSKLHIAVITDDGTRVELPPGGRHMLVAGSGVVRVVAGQASYEIDYEALDPEPLAEALPATASDLTAGTRTEHFAATLTPREIDFLVTFARPHLLGLRDPLPTYAEVAAVWSVSPKTLDNTLQSVKRKFRDAGLIRDQALDVLVHSAVQHSLITRADLDWAQLDSGEPRSASSTRRVTD